MKMLSTLAEHSTHALSVMLQKIGMDGSLINKYVLRIDHPLTCWGCSCHHLDLWPLGLCYKPLFSACRMTSFPTPGIFGKHFPTEPFGFLIIKAYIFHLYPSLPQCLELFRRILDTERGYEGWLSGWSHHLRLQRTTQIHACFATSLPLHLHARLLLACLLTLQSSPCVSEVSVSPQGHKPQVFPHLAPGFSSAPSIGACWAPSHCRVDAGGLKLLGHPPPKVGRQAPS